MESGGEMAGVLVGDHHLPDRAGFGFPGPGGFAGKTTAGTVFDRLQPHQSFRPAGDQHCDRAEDGLHGHARPAPTPGRVVAPGGCL